MPWKPHCVLAQQLNCGHAELPAQQLKRFRPIGRNYHLPNHWTSSLKMTAILRCLDLTSPDGPPRLRSTSLRCYRLEGALEFSFFKPPFSAPANLKCGRKAVLPSGKRWGKNQCCAHRLAHLLTEMEHKAELPIQMRHTNIVMIPKSERIERPIAFTSCLYRLWNSYRKHDLHRWQLGLDDDTPWDHARPHKDCPAIAVGRMLKAEIGKHQGTHTVSCLADLTCFYDTVQLDHIINQPWP